MVCSYKIGIIIPAYNVEQYIFRALESCICQTYTNIEIVVVDDGSSDATYDVVQSYADKDDRIKLYRQENGGVSSARNRALDMCTSDYILFLDSDDWLELSAVERLTEELVTCGSENALISSSCFYAYFNADREIYKIIPENEKKAMVLSAESALMYVGQHKYNLRSSCYKLFSLKLINEHGLRFDRDIRHGEDGLFVFEYLKKADQFIYFPDPLWDILERPGSATISPYNSTKMSAVTAVEKMLAYDNSEVLTSELKKFHVQRMLYVLVETLIAYPEFKNDMKILRKKLRSCFGSYMFLQKSMKLKLVYLFEVFAFPKLASIVLKRRKRQ